MVMEDVKRYPVPINALATPIPTLLQPCKTIRSEASGLFWSMNTLVFAIGTNIMHKQPHYLLQRHKRMELWGEIS